MLSQTKSFTLVGLLGQKIDAEIDISTGKPQFMIVGLPDSAVKESSQRVETAIKNSGLFFPTKKLTVNLAPANIRKEGAVFDLAIAIGILSASGQIESKALNDFVFIGELSLNGKIRPVVGLLPLLISAQKSGFTKFIIPHENSREASFISNAEIFAFENLSEVVKFFKGEIEVSQVSGSEWKVERNTFSDDFSRVKGQYNAKRAMEIAVAGGHNILMYGPPGSGKTMLARCIPSILPDLTFEEALEITKIHSVAGVLDNRKGIVSQRPFRSPHHSASSVSLTGGGKNAKPGEISLAHNGVLFMDEVPEFPRSLLETLRQPLEDGKITVSRASATVEYPASFMLVASMNPCPCGNYGSRELECKCTPSQIQNYLRKLSGPLLDRIDLKIDVDRVKFFELRSESSEESSKTVRERVQRAREIQRERFAGSGVFVNARMNSKQIKDFCKITNESEILLENAFKKFKMSARGYTRILKVARTIADLEGRNDIENKHIEEAISYRNIDKFEL